MPAGTKQKEDTPKTVSATAWAGKKRHVITLPSGATVGIEIPDLPELVKSGQIPNDLVDVAVNTAQGSGGVTREHIEQQPAFYRLLVQSTVKEPEVTEELYAKLPFEDVEMIVEIASRQRDLDAIGEHIGGLHTSSKWRKFRGLDFIDSTVEGA